MLKPRTLAQQLSLLFSASLAVLFVSFLIVDLMQQNSLAETASSQEKLNKVSSMLPLLNTFSRRQQIEFEKSYSRCHEGYQFSKKPFESNMNFDQSDLVRQKISEFLNVDLADIIVNMALLNQTDFSYHKCDSSMSFPLEGLVVSIKLRRQLWLNVEIHEHEWHLRESHSWLLWAIALFIITAIIGIKMISHLTRPLLTLSNASRQFANGLTFSEVEAKGSPDLQVTIHSFNNMQHEVIKAIENRSVTLSAISHDIRTPLTALKLKVELLENEEAKTSLNVSIDKIEKITEAGLIYLKGDHKEEALKVVNLSTLIESECLEMADLGYPVEFNGSQNLEFMCRPIALGRAVRNLIDNALKYANTVSVSLYETSESIVIIVRDTGNGIPEEQFATVVEPFNRLSNARESDKGGFGLGLAIVKAIVDGHGGKFSLQNAVNPRGLVARIELPKSSSLNTADKRNKSQMP
jgi:signal transduction histidine kinase